ncbi:hypothetical protein [Candidatus Methylomicrobium oryzae]|jgi:hypothetical protein|uniref:hypothetical protein n=1 Tax=Candidatus Methylomicrobium oryzae TaxID=2802053 RepID=UPI001923C844|nr:hypothetical protein [Methylomicrobium sp. RS1]MBL1265601.1 hypothetical protein [Methylomicrobium sp. RS1]
MKRSTIKTTASFVFVATLGIGQAYAHTGVRDQVDEGKASYNGFTITHGCASGAEGQSGQAYPVLGQTALFPSGSTAVWRDGTGAVIQQGGDGNGTISAASLSLNVTGYASMSSAFATSQEIVDTTGVVRGLHWRDGAMEPKLNTITPFKITAPTIKDNCVRTLKIRVAVINWCDLKKNEANDAKGPYKKPKDAFGRPIPLTSIVDVSNGLQTNVADSPLYKSMSGGNGDNNRADWWFYDLYGGSQLYKDPEVIGSAANYWSAAITVNNSAADTAACGGTLVDYTVEPAGIDLDTYLTGPNTQPFTSGNGPF